MLRMLFTFWTGDEKVFLCVVISYRENCLCFFFGTVGNHLFWGCETRRNIIYFNAFHNQKTCLSENATFKRSIIHVIVMLVKTHKTYFAIPVRKISKTLKIILMFWDNSFNSIFLRMRIYKFQLIKKCNAGIFRKEEGLLKGYIPFKMFLRT